MTGDRALLIINMLNDFVLDGAPLKIPEIKKIIEPIKKEIEKAGSSGYPVIYLCDSHEKDDNEFKMFPPHAIKNTEGSKIIEELKPRGSDIIVRKNTFSGFFNTELDKILKRLSIKKIIITGNITNISIFFTAADAVIRGFDVDVIKNAVIGLNKRDHKFALEQMQRILKVNIVQG